MKLRAVLPLLVLLAAFSVAALAEQPAPAEKQQGAGQKIIRKMGLSKDQAKQIHAIVQKYRQDVAAVLKSGAQKAEKEAKVKELRTKAGAAIMALLTPEQQAKATKMRLVEVLLAPRPVQREIGFLALVWKLDLTANQKTTIKGIVADSRAAAKAIQQDTSLQPREKTQKLAALRKATNEKILALLTPEQKAKLQEMIKKHGPKK